MRALVADSSAPGGIPWRDVPEPVPLPGEVLVEVRAFSLNRGELTMLGSASDGWRPGWDFAGMLHSDVAGGPRAGTRVMGIGQGGAWAQRITVPQTWIAELPDSVSFADAAARPTAGLTALRTLRLGPANPWSPRTRHWRVGGCRPFRDSASTSGRRQCHSPRK